MTVFIIEDNEIEMENLKTLLSGFEQYTLIGSADTIEKGIEGVNKLSPDILFLDIQLECENSLDHLDSLDCQPYIVCSTLYTEHAIQAFEVGATDYLTKPITHEKLLRALNRIPLDSRSPKGIDKPEGILLKNGTKTERVLFQSILMVTADSDYSLVKDIKKSRFISTRRMREWKEILSPSDFISIDRSTIVNLDEIESFTRLGADRTASLLFKNGEELKIGPAALKRLKEALESS